MSTNYTPETRQRMRPWLEARINSCKIRGLEWINKEQKVFKVPWKNVSNREWSEDDGVIFKEWAIHTGRFREGVDSPDWPTWKTRFRCALTKLPDIRELKDQNQLGGQTDEPYRVYQLVPKTGDSPFTCSPVSIYDEDSNGTCHLDSTPRIPVTVQSQDYLDRLPSDIADVTPCELSYNSDIMNMVVGEGSLGGTSIEMKDEQEDSIRRTANKPYPSSGMSVNQYTIDFSDCKLYITIKYQLVSVIEVLCTNPSGCRILFDKAVHLTNVTEFEQMFGPKDAEQIRLPVANIMNNNQQRLTMDLLNALDRGIVLRSVNGNIYATRKCRCRIYIASPVLDGGFQVIKLQRDEETLVYDAYYFQQALDRYIHQRGPRPSVEVIIGFGQHFTMDHESVNSLLVSATVVHTEAHQLLTRITCTSPMSPGISLSKSDNLDRLMDVLQFTKIQP